jgi:hypothetical protein
MIASVFTAVDGSAFLGLVGIREFFDALFVRVAYYRQTLRTSGLSRAARNDLGGIDAFLPLCRVAVFELRASLEGSIAGVAIVGHAAILV